MERGLEIIRSLNILFFNFHAGRKMNLKNLNILFSIHVLFYSADICNELHFISRDWRIFNDGTF
jgi:hypothetical protein